MSVANLLEGLGKGLLDGTASIISKLKADPTKVIEAETDLEKLRITHETDLKKIDIELEQEFTKRLESENKAVTDRWAADMASDSWLSKNTRPIVLLALLGFLFIIVATDSIGGIKFDVKASYIDLLQILLTTVVVAYYGSRGIEKVASIRKK